MCHGTSICQHGTWKQYCVECKGSSTCKHAKITKFCRECDGKLLCTTANCMTIVSRSGIKCSMCSPRPRTNSRVKEIRFAAMLEKWRDIEAAIPSFIWNKQTPDTDPVQCGRYRVDFTFNMDTWIIALEHDEHQHSDRQLSCELARMGEVSLGYKGLPVHWIRYNPDSFKTDFGITKPDAKQCQEVLHQRLQTALATSDYKFFMRIDYICYNYNHLPGLETIPDIPGGIIQTIAFEDLPAYVRWCAGCG